MINPPKKIVPSTEAMISAMISGMISAIHDAAVKFYGRTKRISKEKNDGEKKKLILLLPRKVTHLEKGRIKTIRSKENS